jgi:protoporphyrinogen oxidase
MDALADCVRSLGVEIRLNTPIKGIESVEGGKVRVAFTDDGAIYDQCLVTTSPAQLARFAPSLAEDYLDRLLKLKSMGAVVIILALKYPLSESGVYWHNVPKAEGFPFLSLVEHTNYVSKDYFGGDHIVYCGDYIELGHEYFSLSKEELLERFLPALQRFNPKFKEDWVRAHWMFRTKYAQPVPPINHSSAIPNLKTPMSGLFFASMSQVYPWDRGTNFAVEIGRKVARRMLQEQGN